MDPHLELDVLGILRQTKLPPEYAWMSNEEKHVMLDLRLSGEHGLPPAQTRKLKDRAPESLLNLEVRNLVTWETDKLGKPTRLALTWRGQELADLLMTVAKHETRPRHPR